MRESCAAGVPRRRGALIVARFALVVTVLIVAALGGAAGSVAAPAAIEDLMFDLQLIPLDAQSPPPLRGQGLDGQPITLGEFRGRPVLIYFWTTW